MIANPTRALYKITPWVQNVGESFVQTGKKRPQVAAKQFKGVYAGEQTKADFFF